MSIAKRCKPSIYYYSLTNINDYDDEFRLDIGYASEDEFDRKVKRIHRQTKYSSNPEIDSKSSFVMYERKYPNSYDTDDERSENDLDLTSSSINFDRKSVYNRYSTATTGYSSDIEHETTDLDEQRLS